MHAYIRANDFQHILPPSWNRGPATAALRDIFWPPRHEVSLKRQATAVLWHNLLFLEGVQSLCTLEWFYDISM